MRRKFREYYDALPVERRAHIEAEVDRFEAEMRLRELRIARDLSQADVAQSLDTDQGNVSRLEQQADMYVSKLRRPSDRYSPSRRRQAIPREVSRPLQILRLPA